MLTSRPAAPQKSLSQQGFTLIELVIALVLFGVLMMLAMHPMRNWINDTEVRSTADSLQNGLRQAKAEAIRRSRTTVFFLTDDTTFARVGQSTPASTVEVATTSAGGNNVEGRHWGLFAVSGHGRVAEFIEAGLLSSDTSLVRLRGPQAVCFNSMGRLITRDDTDVGDAECEASSIPAVFNVRMNDNTRNLNITVSVGGRIQMCDPAKTGTSALDAC